VILAFIVILLGAAIAKGRAVPLGYGLAAVFAVVALYEMYADRRTPRS